MSLNAVVLLLVTFRPADTASAQQMPTKQQIALFASAVDGMPVPLSLIRRGSNLNPRMISAEGRLPKGLSDLERTIQNTFQNHASRATLDQLKSIMASLAGDVKLHRLYLPIRSILTNGLPQEITTPDDCGAHVDPENLPYPDKVLILWGRVSETDFFEISKKEMILCPAFFKMTAEHQAITLWEWMLNAAYSNHAEHAAAKLVGTMMHDEFANPDPAILDEARTLIDKLVEKDPHYYGPVLIRVGRIEYANPKQLNYCFGEITFKDGSRYAIWPKSAAGTCGDHFELSEADTIILNQVDMEGSSLKLLIAAGLSVGVVNPLTGSLPAMPCSFQNIRELCSFTTRFQNKPKIILSAKATQQMARGVVEGTGLNYWHDFHEFLSKPLVPHHVPTGSLLQKGAYRSDTNEIYVLKHEKDQDHSSFTNLTVIFAISGPVPITVNYSCTSDGYCLRTMGPKMYEIIITSDREFILVKGPDWYESMKL